ncbi:hypothetical protein [Endozoicomonas lisbonensis]|uniref:DNA-binding protein H-NS n=1 Tax=Endozoicomonas lisbonensis TaxID=3120522 RepID=A0ABV2SG76_9GAMM
MSKETRFVEARLEQHKAQHTEVHNLTEVYTDIQNITLTSQHDARIKVDTVRVKFDQHDQRFD